MLKKLLLLSFALLLNMTYLMGQSPVFELAKVEVKEGERNLIFKIKALDNNSPIRLRKEELQFWEQEEGEVEKKIELRGIIKDDLVYRKVDVSDEQFTVLFLVDVSSKMTAATLNKAKETINNIVNKYALSNNIKFVLKTYSETIARIDTLTGANVASLVDNLKQKTGNPDLYRLLSLEAEVLNKYPEKKIIFLISDGVNDTEGNSEYQLKMPMDANEALAKLRKLDNDFFIFPIGSANSVGASFLKEIPKQTPIDGDVFGTTAPKNLQNVLKNNQILESTHTLKVTTNNPVFLGENRTYKVGLNKNNTLKESNFIIEKGEVGSPGAPIILDDAKSLSSWVFDFIIGLVILTLLLGGFSLVVPVYRKEQFKKKYVKPYVPEPNIRRIDPILMEPIQEGELIVQRCQQIIPLKTWVELGWQCPNYEDCVNKTGHRQCKAEGAPDNDYNFFGMQGIYRQLNWLWFGMVGGFLGWVVFALFKMFDIEAFKELLAGVYAAYSKLGFAGEPPNFRELSGNTITGIGFGIFAVLMLAWVEERSQSRKTSWARILFRTFLGAIAAFFIFSIGFYFHYANVIPNIYINWLLTWVVFGLAVGLILSINSSISTARGVLGGAIAGALSFIIYILFANLFSDYDFSKLISLLFMGGILGVTLNTIVSAVEDFELEFITPKAHNRIVPISKWLKTGLAISMGRAVGSYVYIRWEDAAVESEHAELSYDKTNVFIEPKAETLVNGRILPLNKKTALKNGDIIHLGRNSITQMRYKEKRQMGIKAKK